jgi:hypothetical protein
MRDGFRPKLPMRHGGKYGYLNDSRKALDYGFVAIGCPRLPRTAADESKNSFGT